MVASMDWPELTKYRSVVSAQSSRQEIIMDLYKEDTNDGKTVGAGMIRYKSLVIMLHCVFHTIVLVLEINCFSQGIATCF